MSSMLFVVYVNSWYTTILQNSEQFCIPIRIVRSLENTDKIDTIGFGALFLHEYYDFEYYWHDYLQKNNTNQKEK